MYKTGSKTKWQRRDLNLRPRAYESPALPLSYAAIADFKLALTLGIVSVFLDYCQP